MIIGSSVVVQATFRDLDGVLTNPSDVELIIRDPSGNQTAGSPTNFSTGVYRDDVTLDEAGWWSFRFEGTIGGNMAVCEGRVCAEESAFVSVSA